MMQHRKVYRSVPLGIAAPSSLLVKRVNESRAARKANTKPERAVDAPPESSEDEDSFVGDDGDNGNNGNDGAKANTGKPKEPEDISDVSDDEPRGSIKSSTFESSRNGSRNSSGKTTNRPASQSKRPGLVVSQSSASASTRGTKRGRDEDSRPAAAAAARTVDLSAKSIEFGGRAKSRKGYGTTRNSGSLSQGTQGSQGSQGSQGRAVFKPPPEELTKDTPPRKASKRVDVKVAKFKTSKYADSEDDKAAASESAETAKAKPSFKVSKYNTGSDDELETAKNSKDGKDKDREDREDRRDKKHKIKKSSITKSNIYGRRKTNDDDKPKEKVIVPRAVFKMPEYDSIALGPDVDVAAFDEHSLESLSQEKADDTPQQPVCPLCKKTVDDETIQALLPGHYLLKMKKTKNSGMVKLNQLKFDEKVMFCAGHKQRTSRHAWKARGYPSIDWEALPARLEVHYSHIKSVLLEKTSTYYRTAYEGSRKTMDDVALVPGYYGRRGQQVLSAAIIQQLSDVLRQQAVEDPVVAARGMVPYVQAVLVPELAVLLIREDMGGLTKITAAEGRQILEDSAVIGEEVMEEERDVVAEESEDENEFAGSAYGDGQYDSD